MDAGKSGFKVCKFTLHVSPLSQVSSRNHCENKNAAPAQSASNPSTSRHTSPRPLPLGGAATLLERLSLKSNRAHIPHTVQGSSCQRCGRPQPGTEQASSETASPSTDPPNNQCCRRSRAAAGAVAGADLDECPSRGRHRPACGNARRRGKAGPSADVDSCRGWSVPSPSLGSVPPPSLGSIPSTSFDCPFTSEPDERSSKTPPFFPACAAASTSASQDSGPSVSSPSSSSSPRQPEPDYRPARKPSLLHRARHLPDIYQTPEERTARPGAERLRVRTQAFTRLGPGRRRVRGPQAREDRVLEGGNGGGAALAPEGMPGVPTERKPFLCQAGAAGRYPEVGERCCC